MKHLFFYFFLLMITTGCESQKNNTSPEIPYTVAQRYFVKNNFDGKFSNPITSQTEFNRIFGAAAVMGKNGKPTSIDFDKEFVVAVIGKSNSNAEEFQPLSVNKTGEELEVTYQRTAKGFQTYTSTPLLLLVLKNKYLGKVKLTEKN